MQIGELAERIGVPTSTLRYYERKGLLEPSYRSEAGYRLYSEEDLERVLLIRRAKRVGLSLSDIRALLNRGTEPTAKGPSNGRPRSQWLSDIAEQRLLDIERRLTSLLVQRHELAVLVQDLESGVLEEGGGVSELSSPVCRAEAGSFMQCKSFRELAQLLDCALHSPEAEAIIEKLRGRHYHVWQEGDVYKILAVKPRPQVREALSQLARLEQSCTVHHSPTVRSHEQGVLLVARGGSAFLYATLFLSLDDSRRDGQ